jgi:hypothetical protein
LCLLNNVIASCSSSLRYKTDVRRFNGGLDVVNRLRPITFTWKQGGMHDIGFGAEDVARVEPLLTFRNNQGEIEGVKYSQLSAVFVNAIVEQQAQIRRQQKALARQRQDLSAQRRELAALKRLVCTSQPTATGLRRITVQREEARGPKGRFRDNHATITRRVLGADRNATSSRARPPDPSARTRPRRDRPPFFA